MAVRVELILDREWNLWNAIHAYVMDAFDQKIISLLEQEVDLIIDGTDNFETSGECFIYCLFRFIRC